MVSVLLVSTPKATAGGACGSGSGSSGCAVSTTNSSVSEENLANYNKETSDLKTDLTAKNSELDKEYVKEQPKLDLFAKLKKDVIDLQTKIDKIAVKYEILTYSSCGASRISSCGA